MSLIHSLLEVQNRQCFYCRCELNDYAYRHGRNDKGWTRDHVIPQAHGGKDFKNVVLACGPCNQRKGCRWPDPYVLGRAKFVWEAAAGLLGVPTATIAPHAPRASVPSPWPFEPSPALAIKMEVLLETARIHCRVPTKTRHPFKRLAEVTQTTSRHMAI